MPLCVGEPPIAAISVGLQNVGKVCGVHPKFVVELGKLGSILCRGSRFKVPHDKPEGRTTPDASEVRAHPLVPSGPAIARVARELRSRMKVGSLYCPRQIAGRLVIDHPTLQRAHDSRPAAS